ncbi:hypothetical protein N1851_014090 [Merluccius polli]|uniref:Uncharacterized protein n=1 Tax=Merluccius polli TaxID=89951 RepID=A0AA47MUM4_MERPO|nr:hypothetical protein N1851_014090 [Merluccius polli]
MDPCARQTKGQVEFEMPRGKSFRRSVAARRREAVRAEVEHLPPSPKFVPGRGTGTRSRPRQYPVSVSGKTHKLVVPAHSVDKKFVLVVGDSHLRTVADGNVMMPKGNLSFGIMTTPGASACHLRTELLHATLPRTPDAVCILAPSNNLTTSSTPAVAGEEFRKLLISARERWHNVFVLDFVPRLTVSPELQNHVSREFHSVAKSLGIPRYSTLEHFPFRQRHLWVRDGVHLSDVDGMGILTQLLWQAAYMHLEVTAPAPRTPPRFVVGSEGRAERGETKTSPREVFVSPPSPAPSDPYVWMEMVNGKKRIQSDEQCAIPPKRRVVRHEVDGRPIVLRECFIPLNPVRFSSSVLAAMDAVVPARLPSPDLPAVPQGSPTYCGRATEACDLQEETCNGPGGCNSNCCDQILGAIVYHGCGRGGGQQVGSSYSEPTTIHQR